MYKQQHTGHAHDQIRINQPPEVPVILHTDTIVQPLAMMVKLFTAPVTRPTVLRPILHIRLAYTAKQIHLLQSVIPEWTELLFEMPSLSLLQNETISWIRLRTYVCQMHSHKQSNGECYSQQTENHCLNDFDCLTPIVICFIQLDCHRDYLTCDCGEDCRRSVDPNADLLAAEWALESV